MNFTQQQLKEMAYTFLKEYNLNNPLANYMLGVLCQITQLHPSLVLEKINEFSQYTESSDDQANL